MAAFVMAADASNANYHSLVNNITPDNGNNTFKLNLPFGLNGGVVDPNLLEFIVTALGANLTASAFVSYDPDTDLATLSFVQGGGGSPCNVECQLNHSIEW